MTLIQAAPASQPTSTGFRSAAAAAEQEGVFASVLQGALDAGTPTAPPAPPSQAPTFGDLSAAGDEQQDQQPTGIAGLSPAPTPAAAGTTGLPTTIGLPVPEPRPTDPAIGHDITADSPAPDAGIPPTPVTTPPALPVATTVPSPASASASPVSTAGQPSGSLGTPVMTGAPSTSAASSAATPVDATRPAPTGGQALRQSGASAEPGPAVPAPAGVTTSTPGGTPTTAPQQASPTAPVNPTGPTTPAAREVPGLVPPVTSPTPTASHTTVPTPSTVPAAAAPASIAAMSNGRVGTPADPVGSIPVADDKPASAFPQAATVVPSAQAPAAPTITSPTPPTPATPTPPTAPPATAQPVNTQLAGPLFSLAGARRGEHLMTVQLNPDNLGPVTVRAVIGADDIRIELFSPSDGGREAIRQILADLRRDLAGGGLSATLDLSSRDSPDGRREREPTGERPAEHTPSPPRERRQAPSPLAATTLDITL